jgi:signal transduction histidine kinase/CheY-like chemotaxis protein
MKRYRDKPKISTWLLCVIPPLVLWAVMTYFIYITDITDPILMEQGINIYGPGFCFGLFGILLNVGILYLYTNLEEKVKDRTLELEAQTTIAVQANRAKSDFLAMMSHEIRTPLNAIIGLSEIELQGKMYDKTYDKMSYTSRNNIAQIHQSGSYLLGIINEILDISKIEAGSFELVPVVYETPSFLGDTINLNLVRLGSKPINFVLEISSDFPFKLKGDELRVKQILNNLLSNAAKYTHEGTITLSVEHENRGENAFIRFTVRDTGIGIRAEDMEKLFANYTQLDTGANRITEGTGLGLAITKTLVEMMGGSIRAESEYGKGSVFTVEIVQGLVGDAGLPAVIGEGTAENLRNFSYITDRKTENIIHQEIPHKKALVVDDISANLLVMRGFLAPYGLQVDDASSGAEAIEKVQQNHYDIIFMDHMMPKMDGVEVVTTLRKIEGFNTPIVAMTTNALRGMKDFYLEHGFSDYLSKPINPGPLDEVIKKLIKIGSGDQETNLEGMAGYQHALITNNDPTPYDAEMFAQRLDMLNHYRVSFENIREEDYHAKFDAAYFAKFTALIESFGEFRSPSNLDPQCGNAAPLLTEAGRREDIKTIRETLPAFYEALRRQWKEQEADTGERETERGVLREMLPQLKKAIMDGQTELAEAIMAELGSANLTSSGRELYFKLYDLLLAGETEKALKIIEGAL